MQIPQRAVNEDLSCDLNAFESLLTDDLNSVLTAPGNGVEEYERHQLIVREMEVASCAFVVLEGCVSVVLHASSSDHQVIEIERLGAGACFGAEELLPGASGKRSFSIMAVLPTRVLRIDKKYVTTILNCDRKAADDRHSAAVDIDATKRAARQAWLKVARLPALNHLSEQQIEDIGAKVQIAAFGSGATVISKVQKVEHLYFVIKGSIAILRKHEGTGINMIAVLRAGMFFGEPGQCVDFERSNIFLKSLKETIVLKISREYNDLVRDRISDDGAVDHTGKNSLNGLEEAVELYHGGNSKEYFDVWGVGSQ